MALRSMAGFSKLTLFAALSLTECVMLDVYVLLFSFSFDSSFFTVATILHRKPHTVKCYRIIAKHCGCDDGSVV